MRLAVLYICTGNYWIFWNDFYQSSELFFQPDIEKDYYVFSDDTRILQFKADNVYPYYQKKIGFPYDTLLRFDCFSRIQDKLCNYDFICFCNANTKFLSSVKGSIFSRDKLTLVSYLSDELEGKDYPLERRPESKAYIAIGGEPPQYYRGSFIGGSADIFLDMCITLRDWTVEDLRKGIIPIWHDESMLNAYILDQEYSVLPKGLLMPEEKKLSETAIILRDKNNYGGNDGVRSNSKLGWFKGKVKMRIRKSIWFCKKIVKRIIKGGTGK